MKRLIEDIKFTLQSLDKDTQNKLLLMVISTLVISVSFFVVFDNPVLDSWRGDQTVEVDTTREESKEVKHDEPEEPEESEESVVESVDEPSSNTGSDVIY